jgi:hypothetical protein
MHRARSIISLALVDGNTTLVNLVAAAHYRVPIIPV